MELWMGKAPPDDAAQRWRAWLEDGRSRDAATGLWWSWVADDGTGYPYEEATAWALLAGVGDDKARTALTAALQHRPLQRDSRRYLFDTAVALAAGIAMADTPLIQAASAKVLAMLQQGRAVDDGPRAGEETATTRWSDAFGLHLLWLVGPLTRLQMNDLALNLCDKILPGCDIGALPVVHAASQRRYAHAIGYAAEGLSTLDGKPRQLAAKWTVALLDTAAHNNGLIPAEVDHGPLRADAAAQAWMLAEQLELAHPATAQIERALVKLTTPEGAIRYEPDSDHRNTWVTAFAVRAALTCSR